MISLGRDTDGITQISLEAIRSLKELYPALEKVLIISSSTVMTETHFVFEGGDEYIASGFSIGYGGEGPNGLWKAIKLFYPLLGEFWNTPISRLDSKKNWKWTLEDGFQQIR